MVEVYIQQKSCKKCLVVVVAFQSVFYLEMHQNNFFIFFKNYFWYQRIKMILKHTKKLIWSEKNKFFKSTFEIQKQTNFTKLSYKNM
jgi:hypothetical protein